MFAADLAMDLNMSLPLPKPQSLGNSGDEEKKNEVEVVPGDEIGDECVISVAPNVSKDAWDLLDVIEGDSMFNTQGVSTNEAPSLKNEENEIYYVLPCSDSSNNLPLNSVKLENLVMEVPVCRTENIELKDPAMEALVWPSLPDPVHLFETSQECKSVVGVDTPLFLSNMDLPTDVSTPDVDLSFLTNQNLELLATPALTEALRSVECNRLTLVNKKPKEIRCTSDEQQVLSQIAVKPTTPPTVAGILRLNTGSEVSLGTGKGAALQLRRKGVKRQLDIHDIEVTEGNNEQSSDGATTTIIITLTGSSTSPTTNIHCVTNNSTEEEAPLKKAKLGEKYIDMRRKNNEASRRSRQSRKEREKEMAEIAEKLTKENAELRQKVKALEKLRDSVKAQLMKVLSGSK